MKKFKTKKTMDAIMTTAQEQGWEVDTKEYDRGGDWIWLRDTKKRILQVIFNVVNGWFMVYAPISDDPIATHMSESLEGQPWYDELLNLFYIEL